MLKQSKKSSKKLKKSVIDGLIIINSTFNNTIVTATDCYGKVIAWASGGTEGFKGAKKGTPFAAQSATEKLIKALLEQGTQRIHISVSGPGPGRETSIRSFQTSGLQIISIKDITSVPFNGCRPPKKRRI
uniref:Small ribosomal subunit protein uS11c n=1 Tax=Cyanidium caldarium TaxID=2771 RepID=RR11_CYACA|nr:ribosomal protein S11 [Cyanidium caldarium]Q9TLV1.1 RecName: Full=Small ribosomal subunit protein uS11c; AltName: Full=30S ribosomal protein S11, chloroplastic [Cyanidium caldarium]AAF12927.1 unknown [Cyanidium caldarium]WDB00292.1 ribosomal protein S11 [Cyanidium caldarium]